MFIQRESVERVDFEGLQIFDYTAGRAGGSSFAAIEVPPGAGHRPAYSKASEKYYYVVEGRLNFFLGGEEFYLGRGDFCLVERGVTFSYLNRTGETASLILVHTPPFQLEAEVFAGD
jgi:mannose-6-phosphate isomerase-like protein (cupin superfamily)